MVNIDPNALMDILNNILKTKTCKEIAKFLNIAPGTITRWIELNDIPKAYQFELMKLNDDKIDYSDFSFKEKDQFYTPIVTAKECYTILKNIIFDNNGINENEKDYTYIEPSAGSGNFVKILPSDRTIALDIEPRGEKIITADYLDWYPENVTQKYIVIGNPPFGLRGQQALKFINHSYNFADYVCFILPQLFESDGKGVPRKRVVGFNLIYSTKVKSSFVDPSNNAIKINCIFQIWSKYHTSNKYELNDTKNNNLKVYSLSDGGTSSSTRNKSMLYKCDIYIPSTCFGITNMKAYETFDDLPGKKGYGIIFNNQKNENIQKFRSIDWGKVAFLSTNSAYNIRTSQILELFK